MVVGKVNHCLSKTLSHHDTMKMPLGVTLKKKKSILETWLIPRCYPMELFRLEDFNQVLSSLVKKKDTLDDESGKELKRMQSKKGSNIMCSPSEDEEECREDGLLTLPRLHPMSTISKELTKYIFSDK